MHLLKRCQNQEVLASLYSLLFLSCLFTTLAASLIWPLGVNIEYFTNQFFQQCLRHHMVCISSFPVATTRDFTCKIIRYPRWKHWSLPDPVGHSFLWLLRFRLQGKCDIHNNNHQIRWAKLHYSQPSIMSRDDWKNST